MTSGQLAGLRTLAFGDLETGIWGAVWGSADAVAAAVGAFEPSGLESGTPRSGLPRPGAPVAAPISSLPVQLDGAAPDAQWQLSGAGLDLRLTPHDAAPPDPAAAHFAQLCRVVGTVTLNGEAREVDCLGLRSYAADVDLHSLGSVRQVLAWFTPDDGIALCSRRPPAAKGHDRDVVTATVIEPDGPVAVAEPRLSTTYAEGGPPARLSLELWLTEAEDEFPRRVAGEALGVGATATAADALVELQAFRCHSRGRDGGGAYFIARPR